jgi:hypothetical protein
MVSWLVSVGRPHCEQKRVSCDAGAAATGAAAAGVGSTGFSAKKPPGGICMTTVGAAAIGAGRTAE